MKLIRIRKGGPGRKDSLSFTIQEALVLKILLKVKKITQYKLQRDYSFHGQQASRILNRLKEKTYLSSNYRRGLREFSFTESGKENVNELTNYLQIKNRGKFEPFKHPKKGKIINAGGGTCEIARTNSEGGFEHIHLGLLASMVIPRQQLYAKSVEGTPFIVFKDEEE